MQNVEGCAGWKGQIRPCPRDRRLATVGKPKVVVTTASARGMVGFGGGRRCSDHPQRARVELNLLFNANAGEPAANILMGRPGQILRLYAYRASVGSIPATIVVLRANDIAITQVSVSFGDSGHVSVFKRDPIATIEQVG